MWTKSPLLSFGSNQVDFGGMIAPASAMDIISSTVAIQDLCIVYILENGGGIAGLKTLFDSLYGESESNHEMAKQIMAQASKLPFMNKH